MIACSLMYSLLTLSGGFRASGLPRIRPLCVLISQLLSKSLMSYTEFHPVFLFSSQNKQYGLVLSCLSKPRCPNSDSKILTLKTLETKFSSQPDSSSVLKIAYMILCICLPFNLVISNNISLCPLKVYNSFLVHNVIEELRQKNSHKQSQRLMGFSYIYNSAITNVSAEPDVGEPSSLYILFKVGPSLHNKHFHANYALGS